ncbi:MAG: hypothetical protein KDC98_05360 [Planctomycetes bacterium]|nr:hypothetical protein [Planctomycetota bacterium]
MQPRLAAALSAGLLCVPALAQTTWIPSEDRRGHAMGFVPGTGVVMLGGESTASAGALRKDAYALTVSSGSQPRWNRLTLADDVSARTEHAIAAGTNGSNIAVLILFGGLAEHCNLRRSGPRVPCDDTFVFENGTGNLVTLATRPPARSGHAMVTDSRRNRVVLFGGLDGSLIPSPLNDLWEYDPINEAWLPQPPPPISPRSQHAMAFDPGFGATAGRVFVFGGTPFRDDLWEYDPWTGTWTDVTPASGPRPAGRRSAALQYHPAFQNLVLFGGEDNTLTAQNDTWTFDRTTGAWTQKSPANVPAARFDHAMAVGDTQGNNLVLLGGDAGTATALEGTWFWNGVNWIEELPPPSPRTGVAMSYDEDRARHVVFGGRTVPGGADLAETWEFEGVNWRSRNVSGPTPRSDASCCYDSARQVTVLFGGRTGGECGTPLNDTWEWNGQGWTLTDPGGPNSPPAMGGAPLVFDSTRNVTWLLADRAMWRYDASGWSELPHPGPLALFGGCFDTMRQRFLVFGGSTSLLSGSQPDDSTWEWDPTLDAWYRANPTGTIPTRRRSNVLTYLRDVPTPGDGRVALFGGVTDESAPTRTSDGHELTVPVPLGHHWSQWMNGLANNEPSYECGDAFFRSRGETIVFGGLDRTGSLVVGATADITFRIFWDAGLVPPRLDMQPVVTANRPDDRRSFGMAYLPQADHIVLFGGNDGTSAQRRDTWLFDGTDWTQGPAPGPSTPGRRQNPLFGYDPVLGEVLMYGGGDSSGFLSDTWSWDGIQWTQRFPASTPGPRSSGVMFETGTRTLIYGGSVPNPYAPPVSAYSADMWEWDGSTWSMLNSFPFSRTDYGTAYDARRDRIVLFGGRTDCGSGTLLAETWEFDGNAWHPRYPTHSPAARERSHLTFDAARGRVLFHGGRAGASNLSDTWEWDGDDWQQATPVASPSGTGSSGHGLSFDDVRRVSVAFGEIGTWDYGPLWPATVESFGSGCAGSNGTPALATKPWAGPWLGESLAIDIANEPPGLGIFVWGFSDTAWSGGPLPFPLALIGGGPGCNLLVSDTITQLFLPGTNPYVSFLWPSDPSFLGWVMFGQAGFLDTGLGNAPVVTHGLRVTFGTR